MTAQMSSPVWRPEQLSAPWLTEVLRRAGVVEGAAVAEFAVEPVGTGQMADSFRLRLAYSPAAARAPGTVVAKFTAADHTSRATALALRTSEVEVRFYQTVASTVGMRTPRCYFADVDTSSAEFVLVLEDLAPARQGDQLEGCTVDQADLALAQLSLLHAPRWADPALARLEWLERRADGANGTVEQLLPALFAGFVERYGPNLGDGVIGVGQRLFARIGEFVRNRPGPHTVQHADYRLDNLLFGTEEGGPALGVVDWQTVTLGPAAADVSYFLGGSLLPADRRAHEGELVRDYHQRLVAAGVTRYSPDQLFTDYRRYAYSGYLMAVGASMLVERTERGDEMFMTMARRHAAHVEDLDAEALLGAE
jgi:hypothetical protein